jgi:hypothetical protein
METDIVKKITPNNIMEIFDKKYFLINIRSYAPTNGKKVKPEDFDIKIYYKIRVRHNEDEKPLDLLNTAIKLLNNE